MSDIFECMEQINFMNCPAQLAKESDECKKTREFIESQDKCGSKAGDVYIVNFQFWYRSFENKSEDNSTATTTVDE